jgi:nucleoside-diphosphate-sugar epimerase
MNVLITGVSGYIGGSVADRLIRAGHHVIGLVRSEQAAAKVKQRGIEPRLGSLDDYEPLIALARRADAVVNAADSDHAFAVTTLLTALAGSGKRLIHTSGSSVVGDKAAGEYSDRVYTEDTMPEPLPEKAGRAALDRAVVAAASRGVHPIVMCPSMIYGDGLGAGPESIQIPRLIRLARESGAARHVGRGGNVWSHVHISDVAEAYLLALQYAPAGSYYFLAHGEASYEQIAAAISRSLGFGGLTEAWPLDEAIRSWGPEAAHFAFGSNSRVRADKAKRELRWNPAGPSLMTEIEDRRL